MRSHVIHPCIIPTAVRGIPLPPTLPAIPAMQAQASEENASLRKLMNASREAAETIAKEEKCTFCCSPVTSSPPRPFLALFNMTDGHFLIPTSFNVPRIPATPYPDRQRRLDEASTTAAEIFETRHAEEQAKFEAEVKENDGQGDEKYKQLVASTEREKVDQEASYEKAKEDVTQMLLHFVTTCEIKLTENQRQAYLAIAKKEAEAASTNPDQ